MPASIASKAPKPATTADHPSLRVKAVPDKGKANAAAIALLSKTLGVAKSSITLVSGDTARLKTLHIAGDPASLAVALAKLG